MFSMVSFNNNTGQLTFSSGSSETGMSAVHGFFGLRRFVVSLSTSASGWIAEPASIGRAWPSRVRTPRFFFLTRGLRLRTLGLVVGAMLSVHEAKEVGWVDGWHGGGMRLAHRFHWGRCSGSTEIWLLFNVYFWTWNTSGSLILRQFTVKADQERWLWHCGTVAVWEPHFSAWIIRL